MINTISAGGAELHLLTLASLQKAADWQVAVASLKNQVRGSVSLADRFRDQGVDVHLLGSDSRFDLRPLAALGKLAHRWTPDIVHSHLPRADLFWLLSGRVRTRAPWVSSVHAIYAESWVGGGFVRIITPVWRRADRVVAISNHVKNWLCQDMGLPPSQVQVIHYGIDTDRFQPEWQPRSSADREKEIRIGTMGRLEPKKGHQVLIRAVGMLRDRFPRARLLIAGPDTWGYGQKLRSLAASLELEDRVEFLGFCPDPAVFMRSLDVFALASVSEGFGQVIIEAGALGLPLVTTAMPPLTEIVLDGQTGLLVQPDDAADFARALAQLLGNPALATKLGSAGRSRVREYFSARAMADQTQKLYLEVLGERQAQGRQHPHASG